jgi:flagellar L-ring protein FlgH
MNRPSSSFSRPLWAATLAFACAAGPLSAQSLWHDETARSLFADKKAHAVGDLLTIIVAENTASSKQNSTKTSKSSGIDAAINSFFYSPAGSSFLTKGGAMPAVKLAGKTTFDGGGQIDNNETITARIAVRVVDALPNGSLVVEGKRQTKISGETTDAVLRGVVRVDDITAGNAVYSYNVADATIHYTSKGVVSDSQRKGWFIRLWEKFAPF